MKNIFYLILIILLSSCGFKVVNNSKLQNYYITSIETSGDRKINFDLKNRLTNNSNDLSGNKIKIVLKTIKTKNVKEKNSKNEITKYLITVKVIAKIMENDKELKTINISDQKDYNVGTQKFQTINAERSTIKILTNSISSKIIRELSSIN
tara:strand:- start:823 stop:1275 length:453 start_codon:yes stop_codon:yes gene_type:complete